MAKTGRLVVVDEDYLSFGLSGEVVATVTDRDPTLLRAPVAAGRRPRRARSPTPTASSTPCCPGTTASRQAVRTVVGAMTDVLVPRAVEGERPTPRASSPPGSSSEGAAVAADQLLAEVQVDKVAAEVLAPVAGVVHLLVEEEAVVTQGAPIARIE